MSKVTYIVQSNMLQPVLFKHTENIAMKFKYLYGSQKLFKTVFIYWN